MAYTKHNFKNYDTLTASQLNDMDSQIFNNENELTKVKNNLVTDKQNATAETKLAYDPDGGETFVVPDIDEFSQLSESIDEIKDFEPTRNLFDKNTLVDNTYIDANGNIITETESVGARNYQLSDFIKVNGATVISSIGEELSQQNI